MTERSGPRGDGALSVYSYSWRTHPSGQKALVKALNPFASVTTNLNQPTAGGV